MKKRRNEKSIKIASVVIGLIALLGVFGFAIPSEDYETYYNDFPESYQTYLSNLHQKYPNWVFIPFKTGLDWKTAVENEMEWGRNVVSKSSDQSWISPDAYDKETGGYVSVGGSNWTQSSESIVRYFMDPRNFLNENEIFQFEQMSYNKSFQNIEAVESILKGTFMFDTVMPDDKIKYGEAFMKIADEVNISPYFIAARVRQEQGAKGTSPLISGKEKGFKGYYNYFNIQASGDTNDEIIKNGLSYAKKQGWNTRYKALKGGAEFINNGYIKIGQDTLYLQKFDVDNSDGKLYWHQYMQNLQAANSEGKTVRKLYDSIGVMGNSFTFKIPVFENMDDESISTDKPNMPSVEPEKFTVSFMDGEKSLKIQKVEKGKAAKAPSISKKGYKLFWDKEYKSIYENTVINAKWIKKPSKPMIKKLISKKKGNLKISLAKKIKGAKGFQISYNGKKFEISKMKLSITNLKSRKNYKIKLRAYKLYKGSKIYGPYSGVKKIKIK